MTPFRRIDRNLAGPCALGLLIPPGRRTMVILRPCALECDLLPIRANGESATFLQWEREEAAKHAQGLYRALEAWACGGTGKLEAVRFHAGGYCVHVTVGTLTLLACQRVPGQPYRPMILATLEDARTTATRIATILCPTEGVSQEIYFNTQQFSL